MGISDYLIMFFIGLFVGVLGGVIIGTSEHYIQKDIRRAVESYFSCDSTAYLIRQVRDRGEPLASSIGVNVYHVYVGHREYMVYFSDKKPYQVVYKRLMSEGD